MLESSFDENIIQTFLGKHWNNVHKMLDLNVISTLKSEIKTTLRSDEIIISEKKGKEM